MQVANEIASRLQIAYLRGVNLRVSPAMYVCLCNRITDRDFRTQCDGQDCSVAMLYRALGAEPQCGKCVPMVRQILREAVDGRLGAGDD